MGSPVTSDTVPVVTGSMRSCDSFKALLQAVKQLTALADWLFDADGLPEVSVAREFGAIIHPPGSVMDIVVASGMAKESVVAQVEKMWLTPEEISAYDDSRESVTPFWVVADEDGKNGAPNIAGRFKLSADFRDLENGNEAGVVGVGGPGGSKDHTLTIDELAIHNHSLTVPTAEGTAADPGTGRFLYTPKSAGGVGGGGKDVDTYPQVNLSKDTGGGKPHNNMPPYYPVVTIYRTSRMS